LTQLDQAHGYWVRLNADQTLTLRGLPVAAHTPIKLREGWNLVSYLPSTSLPVTDALVSIASKYTTVLGYDRGATSFYSSIPPPLNTLQVMQPGKGYWIKMTERATLQYPRSTATSQANAVTTQMLNRPQVSAGVSATNQWINVYSLRSTYNGRPLPTGSVVTAVGEDGRKLGEIQVRNEGWYGVLAVYADDAYTPELDGARAGEHIRFLVNGRPAAITNAATPVWTANGDLLEVDLAAVGPASSDRPVYLPVIVR
jgi:hypothetical protein